MTATWTPSKTTIEACNLRQMMHKLGMDSYEDFWKWSVQHKTDFWEQTVAALEIVQEQKYKSILDTTEGVENAKWLCGAKLNIVDSCFQNKDDAIVLLFQKKGGALQKITQSILKRLVNNAANGLLKLGLYKGAVIAIAMPMTLEAVVIYLAAIKAGISVVTIADSFAPDEIAARLKITKPTLVFTQDIFYRNAKKHLLYKKIISAGASKIVLIKTVPNEVELRKQDLLWETFLGKKNQFTSVKQDPNETITVLFSSGTTGQPKAILWDHTTPIKCASDAYYYQNVQQGDVLCWPTNLGWMMGPWLVFAALINKATIALYDGSPLESAFGHFVEKAKITLLGLVPSMVKQWKLTKSMESYDWDSIKCFSSTGEVSNVKDMEYLMQLANHKPIIEYCGGTEIGGGYITSTLLQSNIPSQFSTQALGGQFVLLDEAGKEGAQGEVFLIPPIMGLSTKLLNKDHYETYYKNTPIYKNQLLRRHGDQLIRLENGYYIHRGRIDDTMNLGGVKVSAVQIEAVINQLDFVRESAAIAITPKNGGPSFLVVYYVASKELEEKEALKNIQNQIKTNLNPLFKVVDLSRIDCLPRTVSNKVKRKELRENYLSK